MKIMVECWDKYCIRTRLVIKEEESIGEIIEDLENSFLEVIHYQIIKS